MVALIRGCLWRIVANHFVAGLVVADDLVVEAAPILGWTRGRRWHSVRAFCVRRGWHGEPLSYSVGGT